MKKLSFLPRLALVLAILLIIWFVAAFLGAKLGLLDKLFAFGTMTIGLGGILAAIVAVVALVALVVSLVVKPRKGWLSALIALAIPLCVFGGFGSLKSAAEKVPFIYDITTNIADAPTFSEALLKERAAGDSNEPLDFGKPLGTYDKWKDNEDLASTTAGALIAEAFPDLTTLTVEQSADDALKAVQGAMEMRGFDNVTVDKAAGTVEGTDEVFWYGFQDDIVARIRTGEAGTAIDFRSTSRVGTSDLGVNAKRIADLSKAVEDRLAKDFPQEGGLTPDAEAIMEKAGVTEASD